MSAWLWAAVSAGAGAEVWVTDGVDDDDEDEDDDVASLVPELPHAPMSAALASAATPVTPALVNTVLVFFTMHPLLVRLSPVCTHLAPADTTTIALCLG
jgi:hypothetical protein